MSLQSKNVYHFYINNDLMFILEGTDLDLDFDDRPKIEDLNNFKMKLRDEVDESIFNKLTSFIDNYVKFYND